MKAVPLFEIIGLLILIAAFYFLGQFFHFGWRLWWYDTIVHLLAGAWIAICALSILKLTGISPQRIVAFIAVGLTASIILGFMWEIFELKVKLTHLEYSGYLLDTVGDLLADIGGGILGSLYAYKRLVHQYVWSQEK